MTEFVEKVQIVGADGNALVVNADGSIDVSGGGGGGAPTDGQYVVMALNGSLTDERVLTAGTGMSLTDTGAGGAATLAMASGNAFPGAPATNARFFRNDLGLEFYYDGTRWLSTTLYHGYFGSYSASANAFTAQVPTYQDLDMYVIKFMITVYVATTNDGSNYWTFDLKKSSPSAADTSLGLISTQSLAANTRLKLSATVNAAVGGATAFPLLYVLATKVASGGAMQSGHIMTYRLIGT